MIIQVLNFRVVAVNPVATEPLTPEEFKTLLTVEYELAVRLLICPCSGSLGGCGAAKRGFLNAATKPKLFDPAMTAGLIGLKNTLNNSTNQATMVSDTSIRPGITSFMDKLQKCGTLSDGHRAKISECNSLL